jgi:hypothetical protein
VLCRINIIKYYYLDPWEGADFHEAHQNRRLKDCTAYEYDFLASDRENNTPLRADLSPSVPILLVSSRRNVFGHVENRVCVRYIWAQAHDK